MATTKVALLASSTEQRQHLQSMLEKCGLRIVLSEDANADFLNKLSASDANVLLVNIDDSDEDDEVIDHITEQTDLPILFNDSSAEGINIAGSSDTWTKKLAEKLIDLANEDDGPNNRAELPHPLVNNSAAPNIKLAPEPLSEPPTLKPASGNGNINVWVLGASLGGPQAVRQFLAAIADDLPVAFILAQHIGANHVGLLAEQLNRVTKFDVLPGRSGHKLAHHQVILTPADKQITFTGDGYLALQPAPAGTIYSPSIDNVMSEVAKHFGKKAGTIVFSGMGDDGAQGCEAIAQNGGIVWAQDIASCVVSSMPDHARKTGKVTYSGKPEQLAQHLYEHYAK